MICTKCQAEIKPGIFETTYDSVACQKCGEVFERSRIIERFNPLDVPKGVEYVRQFDTVTVTASARHFFGILIFAGVLLHFFVMFKNLVLDLSEVSSVAPPVYFIPFIYIPPLVIASMMIFGHVVVTMNRSDIEVFSGIGRFGIRRKFLWQDIQSIYFDRRSNKNRNKNGGIRIKGKRQRTFGTVLRDDKKEYIVSAMLKYKSGIRSIGNNQIKY